MRRKEGKEGWKGGKEGGRMDIGCMNEWTYNKGFTKFIKGS